MWLLYGANGTTGRILLKYWAENGPWTDLPPPTIAGRNEAAIKALAETYGLSCRVFELKAAMAQDLSAFQLVVNLAGPYEDTQESWLQACEKFGLAYLDVSGEWRGLRALYAQSTRYEKAGIPVVVGAGFDTIVGEAALWRYLQKYPSAGQLRLGVYAEGGFSAGTARSAFRMLAHGMWAYEKGKFVPASQPVQVRLPDGRERLFWPATLAELQTFPAWQPVERLETFVAIPSRYGRWTPLLERVTAIRPIAVLLDRLLLSQRYRLAAQMNLSAKSYVFVEAREMPERLWVETEQAYVFTARAVLEVVRLYLQQGSWPGVASAFNRYAAQLWERLGLRGS